MSDAKRTRPHLVPVGDAADGGSPAPPAADPAPAGDSTARGWQFWLLLALAVAALAGLVVQTQHAGELEETVGALEGELFTARTALDAYQVRFDEVRDSVGSLRAQLEQLNALVTQDPLAASAEPSPPDAAAGAAAVGEIGLPADPTD